MTRVVRAVLAALALILTGVVAASPASAVDIGPCEKHAPAIQRPSSSLGGQMLQAPAKPPTGDPFDPKSGVSILQVYGMAGLDYVTYDPACVSVPVNIIVKVKATPTPASQFNSVRTDYENGVMGLSKFLIGVYASGGDSALNPTSWTRPVDQVVYSMTQTIYDTVTSKWGWLLFVIAGGIVIAGAHKARLSASATTALMGLLGVAITALCTFYPTWAGEQMDKAVKTGVTVAAQVGTSDANAELAADNPGTALVSPLYRDAPYRAWVAGTLGSSTSDTAVKYGPTLFKAHAMSWAEEAQVKGNPAALKALVEAKQKSWDETAAKIQAEDPAAYEWLQGSHPRVFAAGLSNIQVISAGLFLGVAFLMIALFYLVVRFVIVGGPLWGPAVVLPALHGLPRKVGMILAAGVGNIVLFLIGAGVVAGFNTAIMASDAPVAAKVMLTGAVTFLGWKVLSPFRRVTRFASDPFKGAKDVRDTARHAKDTAVDAVKAGARARAGQAGAAAANFAATHRGGPEIGPTWYGPPRPEAQWWGRDADSWRIGDPTGEPIPVSRIKDRGIDVDRTRPQLDATPQAWDRQFDTDETGGVREQWVRPEAEPGSDPFPRRVVPQAQVVIPAEDTVDPQPAPAPKRRTAGRSPVIVPTAPVVPESTPVAETPERPLTEGYVPSSASSEKVVIWSPESRDFETVSTGEDML